MNFAGICDICRERATDRKFSACKVMLRKCKVDVVVIRSKFCYNEIIIFKEVFIMKLPEKIIKLRK